MSWWASEGPLSENALASGKQPERQVPVRVTRARGLNQAKVAPDPTG